MDISNLSIDELKIRAYDESVALANAENVVTALKNNLKVISQQISNKLKEKNMFLDDETTADAGSDAVAEEATPATEEAEASDESAESTEDTETATE